MDWILKNLKAAKEYEAQLAEYSKPLAFLTEKIDSYLRALNNTARNIPKSIYEYFYWSGYFGYMCSEVIIPLFRVCVLIDRKHGYPLLFQKDDTTGVIPCTYSEAYAFFHELDIEDTKAILQHWVSPLDYVNLLDCIEQDDSARFATVFSNIENVESKLRTINCAQRLLPLYKMSNEALKFLARKDLQKAEKQIESMRLDEIVSSYNWTSFDDFRCFIEDLFTGILLDTSEISNALKADFNLREVYESLISPCVHALDFRDSDEYNNAVSICEQWDSSPTFVRLWRDLANMAFYSIYRVFKELSPKMSEKEMAVVSSIINNNSKISQLRLNAVIQCLYFKIGNTLAETVESTPAIYIESKADKIRCIGQPYFEAAKERGLIIEDGGYLKWQKSKVLLAYFCGRIYCGDYSERLQHDQEVRDWIIKISEGDFPDKELCNLFREKNISQLRRNRKNRIPAPPHGYELIDEIIEGVRNSRNK